MKVRFKKTRSTKYRDLTQGNVYRVIGIEADDYRIMNDLGQPCLYPPELFNVIDPTVPANWETKLGDEGERYSYPPEISAPGFFEDFFDGKRRAIVTLWACLLRPVRRPRASA